MTKIGPIDHKKPSGVVVRDTRVKKSVFDSVLRKKLSSLPIINGAVGYFENSYRLISRFEVVSDGIIAFTQKFEGQIYSPCAGGSSHRNLIRFEINLLKGEIGGHIAALKDKAFDANLNGKIDLPMKEKIKFGPFKIKETGKKVVPEQFNYPFQAKVVSSPIDYLVTAMSAFLQDPDLGTVASSAIFPKYSSYRWELDDIFESLEAVNLVFRTQITSAKIIEILGNGVDKELLGILRRARVSIEQKNTLQQLFEALIQHSSNAVKKCLKKAASPPPFDPALDPYFT